MGDSDEEYNNKRNRDKFHRERDESNNNSTVTSSNNRYNNTNNNRNKSIGSSYSSYTRNYDYQQQQQQRRYSPSPSGQMSPPYKRKKDWEMNTSGNGGGGGGGHESTYYSRDRNDQSETSSSSYQTQPPCLTFKQFLSQQDDSISDEEAIRLYNEYKIDFKRTQINEFFLSHKEEEWFKSRYHPDEYYKRNDELKSSIYKRLQIFMDLYDKGWLNNLSLDCDKQDELIRFLDACVIKMEDGSDDDIKILLDQQKQQHEGEQSTNGKSSKRQKKSSTSNDDNANNNNESGNESGAYSDDDDNNKANKTNQLHKTSSIFLRNLPASITRDELEQIFKEQPGYKRVALSDPAPDRGFYRRGWVTFDSNVDVRKICWNVNNSGKLKESGAIVNRELTRRIRTVNSPVVSHKQCIKNDIKLATKIVENFDKRWNLWNNNPPSLINDTKEKDDLLNEQILNGPGGATSGGGGGPQETTSEKLPEKEKGEERKEIHYKYTHDSNPLLENITDYLVEEMSAEEEELLGGGGGSNDDKNMKEEGDGNVQSDENNYVDEPKYRQALDKLLLYLRVVHSFDYYNYIEYQFEDSMPNRCGIIHARPSVNSSTLSSLKHDQINSYIKQFETQIKPYVEYKERLDDDTAKRFGLKDKLTEVEKFIKTNTQKLAEDRWLCPLSGKKFKGPEFIRKHLFYKHSDKIEEVKKEVDYFNNYLLDLKRPQLPEHKSNQQQQLQQQAQQTQQSLASQLPLAFGNHHQHHQQQQQQQSYQPPLLPSFMPPPQSGYHTSRQNVWNAQQSYSSNRQQFNNNSNRNIPMINSAFQSHYNQRSRQPPYFPSGSGGGSSNSRELINYRDLDAPEDS